MTNTIGCCTIVIITAVKDFHAHVKEVGIVNSKILIQSKCFNSLGKVRARLG